MHAFWLYFQSIFLQKKRWKLLRRCEIYSKMFRKVSGRYGAVTRDVWKLQGAWKWWKVQKFSKRHPLGRNRQICPRKHYIFQFLISLNICLSPQGDKQLFNPPMGCTKTIHTILSHIFQTFLKQKILIQLGKGPVVCHCGYCTHSRAENLFFVFFSSETFLCIPWGG